MKFLRYNYGHLRAYTEGSDQPNDVLADFIGFCDYPTAFGSLELCSNGFCSCPGAFRKSNDRQKNGCVEVTPVECSGPHSHRKERVSDVHYFNHVDIDAAALRGTDEESCQELCLKNCSCKVVIYRYFTNFSSGDCYLPNPVLSLMNDGKERSGYESSAFIKLPNNAEKAKISDLLRFSYEQLKKATEDFQKKLGQGGFGVVYEGVLQDSQKVAVKVLDGFGQGRRTSWQTNGSLDKWIFDTTQFALDWQIIRRRIHDIAKGLAYLHEECMQRIVHLDVKPQNILLDDNLCAKISDFGWAKLVDKDQSRRVTRIRGTPGYLAPEWCSAFITEKADVYSFGIIAMEILSVYSKAENNHLIDMIRNYSDDLQCNTSAVVRMMKLAVWCLQSDFTLRPSMSMVVKVIEGTMYIESHLEYSVQN
ncbi:unnamed protein product [Withania somnifera]